MKIIISLPGESFSSKFLMNWTKTILSLINEHKHEVFVVNAYESFVPFSRMRSLGLTNTTDPAMKRPFSGKIEYDVWITVDNDIIFTIENILTLIEDIQTHDVVSGLYYTANGVNFPVVAEMDKEYFIENGSFKYLTLQDIEEWKKEHPEQSHMEVAFTGMGFFACKFGVIETLNFPYFWTPLQTYRVKDGRYVSDVLCSEDVSFCMNLRDCGHKVYVNTGLIVGHEKKVVLN